MRCSLDGQDFDCERALALEQNGAVGVRPRTTVWSHGRWNIVQFNRGTGQYGYWVNRNLTVGSGALGEVDDDGVVRMTLHDQTSSYFVPYSSGRFVGFGFRGLFMMDIISPQKSLILSDEVEAYRVRIETALKDTRCSDFVYTLLNKVKARTGKSYDNVLDVFKKVKFYYADTGAHGGYASFEHGERVAYIDNTIKTERFTSADRSAELINLTTGKFMGEILHHVASGQYKMYSDVDFANALNRMRVNGEVFKLMNGKMIPDTDSEKLFPQEAVDAASNYWHSYVDRHCNYPRK
jgi:hypothetical protein